MSKLIICVVLLLSLTGAMFVAGAEPEQLVATPVASTIIIDGEAVEFRAFRVRGYELIMLRDIAYVLINSPGQFDIAWDGNINITMGGVYTAISVEMSDTAEYT